MRASDFWRPSLSYFACGIRLFARPFAEATAARAAARLSQIGSPSSDFIVPKKLSTTALSHHSAFRLVLARMRCFLSSSMKSSLACWLPRSEWKGTPSVSRLLAIAAVIASMTKFRSIVACMDQPWQNEVLCNLIYLNLRTIVTLSKETGYHHIQFLNRDRFFPAPAEPLLRKQMRGSRKMMRCTIRMDIL
jgi:hypothetical protein